MLNWGSHPKSLVPKFKPTAGVMPKCLRLSLSRKREISTKQNLQAAPLRNEVEQPKRLAVLREAERVKGEALTRFFGYFFDACQKSNTFKAAAVWRPQQTDKSKFISCFPVSHTILNPSVLQTKRFSRHSKMQLVNLPKKVLSDLFKTMIVHSKS